MFGLHNGKIGVYLGVRTCEIFRCFVAIVRLRVYYVEFFVFFVTGEFHRFLHRGRVEDCRGEFQKKIFNEAEEIASLNMGARNQYFSINFLGGMLMYANSTLLFLVARKASRVPNVTYYLSSIVE